ncbi:MAG: nicotinate-nucleotide adenylyltransferase [Maricaulaceae bacterium]|jgi:nicotinate-nucleotide adenylyltransferase
MTARPRSSANLDAPNFGALAVKPPDAPPLSGELLAPGMRVGLFGGSFNPVHAGHLHVAREAMRRLGLHRIWWMVSPQNPLKSSKETDDYWRRMAAVWQIADRPGFVVSDIERRLETPYTSATVTALKTRYPRVNFVWVMGADNLAGLHRWNEWRKLMEAVPVAVIARPGDRPSDALRARLGPAAQIYRHARVDQSEASALALMKPPAWTYITAPLHPHSSTALRAARKQRR